MKVTRILCFSTRNSYGLHFLIVLLWLVHMLFNFPHLYNISSYYYIICALSASFLLIFYHFTIIPLLLLTLRCYFIINFICSLFSHPSWRHGSCFTYNILKNFVISFSRHKTFIFPWLVAAGMWISGEGCPRRRLTQRIKRENHFKRCNVCNV